MKRKKKYTTSGVIRIHARGFGFLIPDDRPAFPQDIFIPRRATKQAVDGDHVRVMIDTQSMSEKGPEGRVVTILKRGRSHIVGTITYSHKKGGIYAFSPLLGEEKPICIRPPETRSLQEGDRLLIRMLNWGSSNKECQGEMEAYLGHITDPSCDVQAAIEEFELHEMFDPQTLTEAKAFGTTVSSKLSPDRVDFRKLCCITIDPDSAKDFDDALSIRKDEKGNFHLGVHIADVSHYVKPGSALDKEAKLRCNSIYFPGAVIPMLPHALSSGLCSLKPGVNRLAISVMMILDHKGETQHYTIQKSLIRSKKRFTYKEAKQVLDGKKKSPHASMLELMVELMQCLKKLRAKRGSIEFALPDTTLILDAKGAPKKVEIVEYDLTHQLVEEFMLKANETVATHLYSQGKPLTYRIHDEPNAENIKEFAAVASALGFEIPSAPSAEELQNLFDQARGSALGQFLATKFIRSMKLASYSTQNVGHYGLGLEHYTHFTSPIRRYIDLVVHRLLFEKSPPKENAEQIALTCSEKERLSSRAEQSVTHLKKLRLIHTTYLQKPHLSYKAIVMSIKPFGFSFEVCDLLLEGFISFSSLKGRRKHVYTGDHIKVKLKQIDLITREIEWTL